MYYFLKKQCIDLITEVIKSLNPSRTSPLSAQMARGNWISWMQSLLCSVERVLSSWLKDLVYRRRWLAKGPLDGWGHTRSGGNNDKGTKGEGTAKKAWVFALFQDEKRKEWLFPRTCVIHDLTYYQGLQSLYYLSCRILTTETYEYRLNMRKLRKPSNAQQRMQPSTSWSREALRVKYRTKEQGRAVWEFVWLKSAPVFYHPFQ